MNSENVSMTGWVVAAVLAGGTGLLGFLMKNAFNGLVASVNTIGGKMDVMSATIAKSDGDVRALQARYDAEIGELKRRLERVESYQRERE